jgi:hypothetical protein
MKKQQYWTEELSSGLFVSKAYVVSSSSTERILQSTISQNRRIHSLAPSSGHLVTKICRLHTFK